MKQLFEVGEAVLLRSKGQPHLNGEYTVKAVVKHGDNYACRLTGAKLRSVPTTGDLFSYILEEVITEIQIDGCTYENTWRQTALRKKQEPSELSFRSLMDTLKSPQIVLP